MRRSELINLKYEDMDIKRKPIYVRNKDEFQTKSRKERVLPMHQKLFKTFSKPENGYCFMNNISPWEAGKWVSHSSVYITELYGHLCHDRRKIDRLEF